MTGVTPAEIQRDRRTALSRMPDTCEVVRATEVDDPWGGTTRDETVIATVPCRVSPATRGSEQVVAGRIEAVNPAVVTLPAGTDVTTRDTLRIGSERVPHEVHQVMPRSREYEVTRKVMVSA